MLRYLRAEGQSDRDYMTELQARVGNRIVFYGPDPIKELLPAIPDWFSMATAPHDGTLIRVRDGIWEPCHARFIDGRWKFVEEVSFPPTHWQPMPAAA